MTDEKNEDQPNIDDVKTLIRRAFAIARDSGRPEWNRMSMAVLKNRLLDMTGRTFDQALYGASTFGDLVSTMPDLVSIDRTVTPPYVELVGIKIAARGTRSSYRVRDDLWRATIDYRSGDDYVWDDETQAARKADENFDAESLLPTLTEDEMNALRTEFAGRFGENLDAETDEPNEMAHWVQRGLATRFLPPRLQPEWNQFVVSNIADRLRTWFARRRISLPDDFMYAPSPIAPAEASRGENLRRFIIDVIRAMSQDELDRIQLPASAIARVRRNR